MLDSLMVILVIETMLMFCAGILYDVPILQWETVTQQVNTTLVVVAEL